MSLAGNLNTQPNIRLVIQKGPHAGQRFAFSKSKITIGRSPENDIILVNDPLISRQHAYIEINNNDVEITNLSVKNPILVNNENVNKWKLTNDTVFMIGDTEFLIQIEYQNSVLVVKPIGKTVVPITNAIKSAPSHQVILPQVKSNVSPKVTIVPQRQNQQQQMYNPNPATLKSGINSKVIFYAVAGIIVAGLLYFGLSDSEKLNDKKTKKSTLKYADETSVNLTSKETSSALEKQIKVSKLKQSSGYLRAEENFSKGMRAFQQGGYTSAIEYFQQTLNSQSEHVLAKRYLQLSNLRYDEIVKLKLELGQSYFERNNFKLCKSMFRQVIDMLQSKESLQVQNKDTSLLLAQKMLQKCEFAAEGIH